MAAAAASGCQEHLRLLELEAAVLTDVRQFAACPLTDKPATQRLSSAINEKLSALRALARDLELFAEEADSEEEQRAVAALLSQHVAQYNAVQAELKAAVMQQRRAALQVAADDRRELLAGADVGLRQRQLQGDAAVLAASESITDGLKRTRQVLAEELDHTAATLASMETSHATLGRTKDEYGGQHASLRTSRGLLGVLNWQSKSETYMLWGGLSLFMLVVAYIAAKRVGYFVPSALRPASLLKNLPGRGGAPLPPLSAPPPLPPRQVPGQEQQYRRPPPPPPPPQGNERFHVAPPPVPAQPAAPPPAPSPPAPAETLPPPSEVPAAPEPTQSPPPAPPLPSPPQGSPAAPAEQPRTEEAAPQPPAVDPAPGAQAPPPADTPPAAAAPALEEPAGGHDAARLADGSSSAVHHPQGRPLAVDSVGEFVHKPPLEEAALTEGSQAQQQPEGAAAAPAGQAEEAPVPHTEL